MSKRKEVAADNLDREVCNESESVWSYDCLWLSSVESSLVVNSLRLSSIHLHTSIAALGCETNPQ